MATTLGDVTLDTAADDVTHELTTSFTMAQSITEKSYDDFWEVKTAVMIDRLVCINVFFRILKHPNRL